MSYHYVSVDEDTTAPKQNSEGTTDDIKSNIHWREDSRWLFKYLISMYILLNCIEGVLPCMLPSISHRFTLSPTEQGLLGASYYFVQALVSPATEWFLTYNIEIKTSLLVSYFVNIMILICFNFLQPSHFHYSPLFFMGLLGFPSSLMTVITYVWINFFATQSEKTSWMGILQTAPVIGTVLGYAFATFITSWLEVKDNGIQTFAGPFLDYQLCIMVIIALQILSLIHLSFVDAKHFDIRTAGIRLDRDISATPRQRGVSHRSISMMSHKSFLPYLFGIAGLSFLFFCVRGVNYWSTAYIQYKFTNHDDAQIRIGFLTTAITSPVLGLGFGSWVGYHIQDRIYQADRLHFFHVVAAVFLGCLASLGGMISAFTTNFYACYGGLWLLLFFGGAVLPLTSVTVLEILPVALRTRGKFMSHHSLLSTNAGKTETIRFLFSVLLINFDLRPEM